MTFTFEQSKDEIAKLVHHFRANRTAFLAADYKEAHARHELIDPLFIALNWDVHNRRQAAPDHREVVVEDSLEIAGQKKAPDYAFRVGRDRKFFGEAKKPGVNLQRDPLPAYQLRRYAWSAKLPLSILTDFEELAVYDCRIRPAAKDKATVARINYISYEEYPDRWREVWDVFSAEAVRDGSFDQFAEGSRGKRGTSQVDSEFLAEIEGWRLTLAKNIALRNPALTVEQLNDAVQRTIDRIIFLRMAEDRGIEAYGRLQRLAEGDGIYAGLIKLSRLADEKYNSGLFDFSKAGDRVTPGLAVDDKALRPILADLYFPQSPYEFSVMPAEILGNVYEQFLGKVIRLTAGHQAKVEEKPEVKKAGGVKYTPTYIVEHIVQNTVGTAIAGKSPAELKGFTVLDPACGSGSFLLVVYATLLAHYLDWFTANDPEKYPAAVMQVDGVWQLTLAERKRILTEHVFGVDLDRQAVEVTKLSLLLKVLEVTQQLQLFSERILPNLDKNIKCGNSLIGPDYFHGQLLPDASEMRRVNAFDWAAEFPEPMRRGGFDCIVGNPPYIRIQTLKEWAPLEVEAYKALYQAAGAGNYDIYVVFVEKGLALLTAHGRLGFILPHKFFSAKYGAPLRRLIAAGKHLSTIVHFGDQQVFEGVSTYTCLLFLTNQRTPVFQFVQAVRLNQWRDRNESINGLIDAETLNESEWNLTVGPGKALFNRLGQLPVKLADIAERVFQGLVTGADPVFILSNRSAGRYFSEATQKEFLIEGDLMHPLCKGSVNIRRYHIDEPTKSILFPYRLGDGRATLLSPKELAEDYPNAWGYLRQNRAKLEAREHGKWRHEQWYAFGRSQNLSEMEQPKLLTPSIANRASFTFDSSDYYFFVGSGGGGGGGYGITIKPDQVIDYRYLLGLLNSTLLDVYLKSYSSAFSGGYYAYNRQYIERLPIRMIDFSDQADKARHEQMVSLVGNMLDLHQRRALAKDDAERTSVQRLIEATDRQVDGLVYELYCLTPEEIAIVESACEPAPAD